MVPIFMRAESYLNRKTQLPEYSANGYYITEKFDGQRAQWDYETGNLISRYGNKINCPIWFLEKLRGLKCAVDGELFFGYDTWDLTGLFRSSRPDDALWKRVKFMVFDIADPNGGTYMERRKRLERLICDDEHIKLVPYVIAVNRSMIEAEFKNVISRGGEGIMLNNPHYMYRDGKCAGILKYKKIMDDECVIVGYKMGNGRLNGMLGSFIVHPIEDGQPISSREFSMAGINDHIRANYKHTHPIGTLLHYRCAELTKSGKPKHPVYLGICRKNVTNNNLVDPHNPSIIRIRPPPVQIPLPLPLPLPLRINLPKLELISINQSLSDSDDIDIDNDIVLSETEDEEEVIIKMPVKVQEPAREPQVREPQVRVSESEPKLIHIKIRPKPIKLK